MAMSLLLLIFLHGSAEPAIFDIAFEPTDELVDCFGLKLWG